ncbi:GntR family transcriptional regulator [Desulfovibrio sp. OttesenSCG-928-O18]|nr:GntR family transcriptional regulator [Desulfovibrio sp. OttesenSCG-928-O18]
MYEQLPRSKTSKVIEDNIRRSIIERRLKPGDRLASEKELADSFGVSRQTLREALNALESLGLVELRKGAGGGAFVSAVPFLRPQQSIMDFLYSQEMTRSHIIESRLQVEPYAARIAATSMTTEQKDELVRVHQQAVEGQGVRPRADLRPLEVAFHHCITLCIPNPMLRFFSDLLINLVHEINIKNGGSVRQDFGKPVNEAHGKILDAILRGDADEAERLMRDDLLLTHEIWETLYKELNGESRETLAELSVYGDHVVSEEQKHIFGGK